MQHVTKNLPPQLFQDEASGLRSLEERERQRVLAIIETLVLIAAGIVIGMLVMGILVTL